MNDATSDTARAAGRVLARRHQGGVAKAEPEGSLVNYAESPRTDQWTLRSSMTRLAQPEPELVLTIATLMRRLDAVLHHVARALEQQTVTCDRRLTLQSVDGEPLDPCPDTRTADLARLMVSADGAADEVLAGYRTEIELGPEETAALPLLMVAVSFDTLADTLVEWARNAPAPLAVDEIATACASIRSRLDELGVPVEEGPPPRGRRRS